MKTTKKKLARWAAIALLGFSGIAGATNTYRSAVPVGTASSFSSAVNGDVYNAVTNPGGVQQSYWQSSTGSFYHASNGTDYQTNLFDFSVFAFGALCNGVSDDSAAFNACSTAANAIGGGTCYVPHTSTGCKVINVILKDGVHLRGDDGAAGYNPSSITRTRLIASGTGIVIDTPAGGATMASVQGFVLVGLGAGTACKGIRIQNGSWDQIKNVTFDNFADEGFVVVAGQADTFEDILTTNTVLNRTRTGNTGACDVGGTDHYLNRVECNTSESSAVSSASLYVDGIVIRGSNNFIANSVGEFSDIGLYVSGSNNRFANVRADHNMGHGFYVSGGGNTFATDQALDNSQATSNTYSGFYVSGQSNLFSACWSGGAGTTQQYGFDDSGVQNTTIYGRSTYSACAGINNVTSLWHQNAFTNVDSGIEQPPAPFHPTAGTTAPNIEGTSLVVMDNYNSATNVTNFTGGTNGQTLYIFGNANVTLVNSASIITNTGANKVLKTNALYVFKNVFGAWYELNALSSPPTSDFVPSADNTYSLGNSIALGDATNLRWKNASIANQLRVEGSASICNTSGNCAIGNSSSGVSLNGSFQNVANGPISMLPSSNATSGSQLQNSQPLQVSIYYWNGSASTRADNQIYGIADSTTPTTHISMRPNGTDAFEVRSDKTLQSVGMTFASLPSSANGSFTYCSDCTIANPCASGGTGAFAKRLNGAWVCN